MSFLSSITPEPNIVIVISKVLGRGSRHRCPIYERFQVMEYCCETK